jgi:pimeloyl-ACP methyl ester carboxylesterase
MPIKDARQLIFGFAISFIGRILVLRDRLLGWVSWRTDVRSFSPGTSQHTISSGKYRLDAVLVRPDSVPGQASILICHGIGETVEHWLPTQLLLAESGVVSLVFDYSGFGRSSGLFSASQSEQDAIAAFDFLQGMTNQVPTAILGFSLGSGVAATIVSRVPACSLMLLAAFTSLRNAAVSIGLPNNLLFLVPPVWDAGDALGRCRVPVLVVHGEKDRLFPTRMAEQLRGFCGGPVELVVVPKLTHNEPFRNPQLWYWDRIISRFALNRGPVA